MLSEKWLLVRTHVTLGLPRLDLQVKLPCANRHVQTAVCELPSVNRQAPMPSVIGFHPELFQYGRSTNRIRTLRSEGPKQGSEGPKHCNCF